MNADEIRNKSQQEILDELDACKRELLNIRFQWQAGETRNPAQRSSVKKTIARLLTVLRERELNIGPEKKEE
ncbi:MAG: 50S ribosomal protein L29 [wastewater metagenome]|nr:50S ribosomal protein L29 [Candidatus Loosdrechtia aerotolerans]